MPVMLKSSTYFLTTLNKKVGKVKHLIANWWWVLYSSILNKLQFRKKSRACSTLVPQHRMPRNSSWDTWDKEIMTNVRNFWMRLSILSVLRYHFLRLGDCLNGKMQQIQLKSWSDSFMTILMQIRKFMLVRLSIWTNSSIRCYLRLCPC